MVKRKIIEINEDLCDGCAACIPSCPEGALQVIDGKARLISDLFCDGLGACVGECPTGAMNVIEREAQPYDETKVMETIVKQGQNVIKAHLQHLKEHGEEGFLNEALGFMEERGISNPLENEVAKTAPSTPCGCPGAKTMDFSDKKPSTEAHGSLESELRQWPVQFHLVNPSAPYFKNADILVSADCVPFAYGNFHQGLLKNKALIIGCPKLDDLSAYKEKMKAIIEMNEPKSITVAILEVPCCGGMYQMVKEAVADSGKDVPVEYVVVGVGGDIQRR